MMQFFVARKNTELQVYKTKKTIKMTFQRFLARPRKSVLMQGVKKNSIIHGAVFCGDKNTDLQIFNWCKPQRKIVQPILSQLNKAIAIAPVDKLFEKNGPCFYFKYFKMKSFICLVIASKKGLKHSLVKKIVKSLQTIFNSDAFDKCKH